MCLYASTLVIKRCERRRPQTTTIAEFLLYLTTFTIVAQMASSKKPARRSGRQRQPNKKYSIDAFEGIEGLVGSESEEEPPKDVDSDQDAEFNITPAPGSPVETEDEGSLSLDEGSVGDASDLTNENNSDDDVSIIGSEISEPRNTGDSHKKKPPGERPIARSKATRNGAVVYVRGLEDIQKSVSKGTRIQYTFGSDADDIIPYYLAREKWGNDTTLPSRYSSASGNGGMHRSFYYTTEMQEREKDEGWRWYYDENCKDRIQEKQSLSSQAAGKVRHYMNADSPAQTFFIGPGSQTIQTLKWGEPLNLSRPWQPGASPVSTSEPIYSKASERRGWIMNLGSKRIQCLDWKPNERGSTQYLAVTIENAGSYANHRPFEAPEAPAFVPRASTPASLQIWSFEATPIAENGSWTIDATCSPKLRLVLCTDWGDIRALKWCPMPDRDKSDNSHLDQSGLIAGIWADGYLRVIDVSHAILAGHTGTEYAYVESVAFQALPPDSVFTSLAWLSTFDIAASTAQGFVAIFNIANGIKTPAPRPWFFKLISETYILNITSGYPSRPHILFTTSMSGYLRMTDLRAPVSDSVESARFRLGSPTLAWHEASQCLLTCDETPNLRSLPIRRFFSSMLLHKLPAPSHLSQTLVTSPVHSCVLIGLTNGSIIATNPLRRIQHSRSPIFSQKWFHHEFSASTPRARELGGEAGGVVRFSDGFKVENASAREKKQVLEAKKNKGETGLNLLTVYEEKTCITALGWNPNLHCGGWAAAGMGSGLLRVEDVALDRAG